jgi:hypothetical protein
MIATKDFKQSAINSFLDFDKSLGVEIDNFQSHTDSGVKYWNIFVILAHLGIFIFIFLIFKQQFNLSGVMSLILLIGTIFILHLINFTVISDNEVTLNDMKNIIPFSGLFNIFTDSNDQLEQSEQDIILDNTENISLDLSNTSGALT